MSPDTAQDLVRAYLKSEGIQLSYKGKALSPMEEAISIREMTDLLHDAALTSPIRAEGSLTMSIKAQRWDEKPTAEVPVDPRLVEAARNP